MNTKIFFIPVLLISFLIGCANNGVSNNEIKKLDGAIKKWETGKAQDYSFIYEERCFCPYFGEVEVVVFSDTVYAVKDPGTGEDITIETENGEEKLFDVYPELFITIDGIFERLKDASLKADEMEGSYDSQVGYPKQVSIDYYKDAVDDEVTYVLSNYQILTLTNN